MNVHPEETRGILQRILEGAYPAKPEDNGEVKND